MAEKKLEAALSANPSAFEAGMRRAAGALERFNNRAKSGAKSSASAMRALNTQVQALAPALTSIGNRMQIMGAVGVASFAALSVAAGRYADEIGDMALTFGISERKVRAMKNALGEVDVDLKSFQMTAISVVGTLRDASGGNEKAADAFRRLGIDANSATVKAMGTVEVMELIADRLSKVRDQQEKIELGRAIGLGGRTFKAMMNITSEKLAAQEASPTFITDEQQKKLNELSNAYDRLGTKAGDVWKKAMAEAAPAVTEFIGHINRLLDGIARWIDANPTLTATLIKLGVGMAAVMVPAGKLISGIAPLMQIMTNLSLMTGGVGGGMGALGAAMGGVTKAVGAMLAGAAPFLGYLAVAAAAVGALALAWKDAQIALEAYQVRAARLASEKAAKQRYEAAGFTKAEADKLADPNAPALDIIRRAKAEGRYKSPVKMAAGGIITQPTYAMVGEAGAEAVIPLEKFERLQRELAEAKAHMAERLAASRKERIANRQRMHRAGPVMGWSPGMQPAMAGAGAGDMTGAASVLLNFRVSGVDTARFHEKVQREARRFASTLGARFVG